MFQTIRDSIQANRELHLAAEEVQKEVQKTCRLVKANGYALDAIPKKPACRC